MSNLLEKHAKSFYWASFFLSKKTFNKCSALYNFCRTLDDIVDDESKLEIRKENFIKFKKDFCDKDFNNPIIKEMWSIIESENISEKVVNDLFYGVETDLKENVQINSKKDLLVYSYRVAGTVGLMMAKILNVHNRDSLKSAIDLGIAMQLTNISRDVIEDSKNNRFYISHNFESIKETLDTADLFYESSFASLKKIPFSFRFSILVARRIYREIGQNIVKKQNIENYNRSGKIYVSNIGKIIQTALSLYDLIRLSLIETGDHSRFKEHEIINEEINLNERF